MFAASGNSVAPLGVGETAPGSAEQFLLSCRIRSGKTKLLLAEEEEDGGEVSSRISQIRCVDQLLPDMAYLISENFGGAPIAKLGGLSTTQLRLRLNPST